MTFNVRGILAALNEAKIRYVVVGGLAVILHGYLRATADIDLVISLAPDNCRRAMDALASIGFRPRLPVRMEDFADPVVRDDWVKNRNMLVFQLWDPDNAVRSADIFVREPIPFDALFEHAVVKRIGDIDVPVASIGHLIEMKSVASRERDRDDIEHLRRIRELGEANGDP